MEGTNSALVHFSGGDYHLQFTDVLAVSGFGEGNINSFLGRLFQAYGGAPLAYHFHTQYSKNSKAIVQVRFQLSDLGRSLNQSFEDSAQQLCNLIFDSKSRNVLSHLTSKAILGISPVSPTWRAWFNHAFWTASASLEQGLPLLNDIKKGVLDADDLPKWAFVYTVAIAAGFKLGTFISNYGLGVEGAAIEKSAGERVVASKLLTYSAPDKMVEMGKQILKAIVSKEATTTHQRFLEETKEPYAKFKASMKTTTEVLQSANAFLTTGAPTTSITDPTQLTITNPTTHATEPEPPANLALAHPANTTSATTISWELHLCTTLYDLYETAASVYASNSSVLSAISTDTTAALYNGAAHTAGAATSATVLYHTYNGTAEATETSTEESGADLAGALEGWVSKETLQTAKMAMGAAWGAYSLYGVAKNLWEVRGLRGRFRYHAMIQEFITQAWRLAADTESFIIWAKNVHEGNVDVVGPADIEEVTRVEWAETVKEVRRTRPDVGLVVIVRLYLESRQEKLSKIREELEKVEL